MNLSSPKNWKTVKLGDVCKSVSETFDFSNTEEVVFINTGDVTDGKFLHSNLSNTKKLPGQAKKKFQKGDILYSEIRPINKHFALVDFDSSNYVASTKLMILRTNENIDLKYFYTWITSYEILREMQSIAEARSGTFPQLTFYSIANLEIPTPESLDEQREIASILGSLDDKIELLRKENKTLENIAQTLFKEWFVDFRFPGHEGVKMIDGLPEGWKIGKLGEFINLRGGLSYDGNLISDKGIPMLTMGFVSGVKRFEWSGLRFYKGSYKDQNKVKVGDLVIATRDVTQDRVLIGSPALIPELLTGQDIIAATNLYIVENINYLSNKFIYWLLKTPDYRERIVGACKGTTIVMITKDSILDYEFVVPSESVAKKFDEINDQILSKCEIIDSEIQSLSRLRDDLLNKIFNV